MQALVNLKHHFDDYECMWNGIEDIYMNTTGETLPSSCFFTLAQIGSVCYRKTDRAEMKRTVALGDGRTKKMYAFLAPIIGFEYQHYEFSRFERAMQKAKSEIDAGYPVVLGALDMFYLPYYPTLYQKYHIPLHYVLMVGYDDENACVKLYDCGREDLLSIGYADLRKSMDCAYLGLSHANTVCTVRMDRPNSKFQIAQQALLKKAEWFRNPPAKFLGRKGMEKLICDLPKWKTELSLDEYDQVLTNMVLFFGTVPSLPNLLQGSSEPDLLKFMGRLDVASDVLSSLGTEFEQSNWIKAAASFLNAGRSIEQITNIVVNYLTKKADETRFLPEAFSDVLAGMDEGFTLIKSEETE
jgi:hypothetical protein